MNSWHESGRAVQWRWAEIRHQARRATGAYRLEWVREPHEAFRLRPERCINETCQVRLNMPGTIGTCSAVCRNAVDARLMAVVGRRG